MFYEQWTYLAVFAVLLSASLGVPIPEDVPLLTGGYLCHAGYANLWIMIPVGLVGVLLGDIFLFFLGRWYGHHLAEHRWTRRIVRPDRLLMAERLFQRHGVKIIFIGRFMPGFRPMIFTASGVLKVRPLTFLLVNGSAACISVPTLIWLGMVFGSNLAEIKGELREVTHLLVLAVAVAAVVAIGIYIHHRQRAWWSRATQVIDPTVNNPSPTPDPSASEPTCPPALPNTTPARRSTRPVEPPARSRPAARQPAPDAPGV